MGIEVFDGFGVFDVIDCILKIQNTQLLKNQHKLRQHEVMASLNLNVNVVCLERY